MIGGAAGAIHPWWAGQRWPTEFLSTNFYAYNRLLLDAAPFLGIGADAAEGVQSRRVPMLPVIGGDRETHHQIVLYSILLLLVSIAPVFLHLLGPVYLVLALILNGMFLWRAVIIWGAPTNAHIWRLYKFSLLYLALLFLAMGIDHLFYTASATLSNIHWHLPL